MEIPPGLTSKAQPADVSWNKPFKTFMRNKWVEKLSSDLTDGSFKAKAPTRIEMMNWVVDSWNNLSKTTIISGFEKANLIEESSESVAEAIQSLDLIEIPLAAFEKLQVDSLSNDNF
jgi:hypothetical protein